MNSSAGGGAPASPAEHAAEIAVHLIATGVSLATLWLVGQPLYANDTWIHLALGEAFAVNGPWLAADPFLFAAPGPPAPSSWLGSLAIFATQDWIGFTGLRIAHVAFVALTLALAWACLWRATASRSFASFGLVTFILLSTYRIVQLRPHLWTIAAMLAVYLLVLAPRAGPRGWAIALATGLTAIWANVHAAFLLGPLLVLGSAASVAALGILPGRERPADEAQRIRRLLIAGGVMWIATLLNPQGLEAQLAYFSAGDETVGLQTVVDEWGPTNLLAWPVPRLPPTVATWLVCWVSALLAIAGGVVLLAERAESASSQSSPRVDPVLVALAAAAVIGSVFAARFLWLCVFAVALGGALLRHRVGAKRAVVAISLGLTILATGLHFRVGDWPIVSRGLFAGVVRYEDPYWADKYFAHSIWFLKDAEVEGRVFNDYPLGGFMSFWLSPRVQMSSSGTMNVERPAMEANFAIASRSPDAQGRSFANVLASQDLDFFLATGLPVEPTVRRPVTSTMRHLAGQSDWMLVFRSLRSGVFLRINDRSAANLERIRAFYASEGVPFDPEVGFDTERVIARAPDWAYAHGIIPAGFGSLRGTVRSLRDRRKVGPESHALADLYAVLGLYRRSLEVDRAILQVAPKDPMALQRRMWTELQLGQLPAALDTARKLESIAVGPEGSGSLVEFVESISRADAEERDGLTALLPLFGVQRGHAIQAGFLPPAPRLAR